MFSFRGILKTKFIYDIFGKKITAEIALVKASKREFEIRQNDQGSIILIANLNCMHEFRRPASS